MSDASLTEEQEFQIYGTIPTSMRWHPIETAPRDGTLVLAWFADGEGHTIISWYPTVSDGSWGQELPGLGADIGYLDGAFTHWMPLPEPPK